MKKINNLSADVIRQKGTAKKDLYDYCKKDVLNQYLLKATFDFNNNDRFFISSDELRKFMKNDELKIRTVTKKIIKNGIAISRSRLVNNDKIHLFASSKKVYQFDAEGHQVAFKHGQECILELHIDNMGWIDIFISKQLSDDIEESLHISLIPKK